MHECLKCCYLTTRRRDPRAESRTKTNCRHVFLVGGDGNRLEAGTLLFVPLSSAASSWPESPSTLLPLLVVSSSLTSTHRSSRLELAAENLNGTRWVAEMAYMRVENDWPFVIASSLGVPSTSNFNSALQCWLRHEMISNLSVISEGPGQLLCMWSEVLWWVFYPGGDFAFFRSLFCWIEYGTLEHARCRYA